MWKDFREGFVEGVREGFEFYVALITAPFTAPFMVCSEFIHRTGRFKPRQDDSRPDQGESIERVLGP
jgi:hypothetical protein